MQLLYQFGSLLLCYNAHTSSSKPRAVEYAYQLKPKCPCDNYYVYTYVPISDFRDLITGAYPGGAHGASVLPNPIIHIEAIMN